MDVQTWKLSICSLTCSLGFFRLLAWWPWKNLIVRGKNWTVDQNTVHHYTYKWTLHILNSKYEKISFTHPFQSTANPINMKTTNEYHSFVKVGSGFGAWPKSLKCLLCCLPVLSHCSSHSSLNKLGGNLGTICHVVNLILLIWAIWYKTPLLYILMLNSPENNITYSLHNNMQM